MTTQSAILSALLLALGLASPSIQAWVRGPSLTQHFPAPLRSQIVLEAATVESCLLCHMGPLSLAGSEPDVLLQRIEALAGDQQTHPVPVPVLTAADLASLARRLAAD